MCCFAYSCLDLSDDAQKAKLKLQAVSCLRSIFMLFDVHLVIIIIIINLACFSCETKNASIFLRVHTKRGSQVFLAESVESWDKNGGMTKAMHRKLTKYLCKRCRAFPERDSS